MKSQRGFSVMEIIVALAVALIILVAFLTVFTNSNEVAVASRNRSIAILLAQGMMDDIDTHTFGNPAPQRWSVKAEHPVTVWVGDREQKVVFEKTVTYENGSFVGQTSGRSDVVTVVVTWREDVGDTQADQATTSDNKKFEVKVPVWRSL